MCVSLVFIALVTAFKGAANSALKKLGSVWWPVGFFNELFVCVGVGRGVVACGYLHITPLITTALDCRAGLVGLLL